MDSEVVRIVAEAEAYARAHEGDRRAWTEWSYDVAAEVRAVFRRAELDRLSEPLREMIEWAMVSWDDEDNPNEPPEPVESERFLRWIREHPGATREEMLTQIGIETRRARRDTDLLVLVRRAMRRLAGPGVSTADRFTDAEILQIADGVLAHQRLAPDEAADFRSALLRDLGFEN